MSCYDANSCMCEKCRREILRTVAFLPSEEEGVRPAGIVRPPRNPWAATRAAGFFRIFQKFGPRTGLFPEILPIDIQVRSLLRSYLQGEPSRASLAPGLYHPSPSIFSPSWSDRQGAVDDGAITGLRMRRSSAVRRPTPCHFSSLSSLLVHSSLFFRPTTVAFVGGSLKCAGYE